MSTLPSALLLLGLVGLAQPAHAVERFGVRGEPQAWDKGRFEFGLRLTHLRLTDRETSEQLPMGGAGLYLRYRLSRRFGIEGALDAVSADELGKSSPGEVVRVTAPFTLNGLFYLFPDSKLQMYLLLGVGVADHEISYDALGERVTYTTPVGQAGVGAQYRLESVRFDLSLRSLSFGEAEKDPGRTLYDTRDPNVAYRPRTDRGALTGAMITGGVNWGW